MRALSSAGRDTRAAVPARARPPAGVRAAPGRATVLVSGPDGAHDDIVHAAGFRATPSRPCAPLLLML